MHWFGIAESAALSAGAVWILGMAWGAGRPLLRLARPGSTGALEGAVLRAGLGLGALSLLLLGLGMAGLFRPWVLAAVCAAATASAAHGLRGARPRRLLPRSAPPGRAVAAALAAVLALTWLTALSPPIFYDALVYHLGVPNLYLLRGGVVPLPTVVHSNFPLGASMIYALALWAGGPSLAQMASLAFALLGAAALAALALRHWGERAAWLAALLYCSTPTTILLARYAVAEHAMSLHVLLAVLCLFRWREQGGLRWAALGGLFAGFACGTKLAAVLPGLAVPALAMAAMLRRGGAQRGPGPAPLLLFVGTAAAAASPWFLKNLLFTGNPFYPALGSLLPVDGWGAEQARMVSGSVMAAWVHARTPADVLLLPLRLVAGADMLGAGAKPLLVLPLAACCAVPLLRGAGRDGWRERLLVALPALCLLAWSASFWMVRLLLPALGLCALVAAAALAGTRAASPAGRAASLAAVLLAAANVAIVSADAPTVRSLAPALGLGSRGEYLGSLLRSHQVVEHANAALPPRARVLVIGESKVAYLRRDHLYQTVFDRPLLDLLVGEARQPGEMIDRLRRQGVTHVLVNLVELERHAFIRRGLPFSTERLQALLEHLATGPRAPLAGGNRVFLFEL